MSTSPPSRGGVVRPQQRVSAVAVLVGVLVVVGAAVGFTRGAGDDAPAAGATDEHAKQAGGPGPYRTAPPLTSQAQLTDTFAAMSEAVTERKAADFVEAAGGTAWARQTWRNLAALGIADVWMRVVDSAPASTPGLTKATVKVSWAPGAGAVYDGARTAPRPVTFTLRSAGVEQLRVLRVGAGTDGARPVWLLGELDVTELRDGAVVLRSVPTGQAEQTRALTRRALAAVDETITSFPTSMRRQVVVVAPATTRQAAVLTRQPALLLKGTTAVTATVDGSGRAEAPVQIVINLAEFDRLDRRGAEVVVTHEATHAATGAASVDMPLWVAEGFADWVALRDGSVPVRVAAAQLLASVRADGIPKSLPTQSRFDRQDSGAVESYEAGWTAFRVLERRAGKVAVVGFYADVLAGVPVGSALQRNTGLDVPGLTAAWRADVGRLARD